MLCSLKVVEVIKGRSQGEGVVQCGHLANKGERGWVGFFRCGRPHFLALKTSSFLKFMMCPHGQGGSIFLCGRPLWMVPTVRSLNGELPIFIFVTFYPAY